MLFIDSASAIAEVENRDLLVKRNRYPVLPLPLAAMALYMLQATTPGVGAGNRASMRGGGPLVTLIDPGQGLWQLLWANVPYGKPATRGALPWMRATSTSEAGQQRYPEHAHPAEMFFGMPRRLRLVADGVCVTGVIQRIHGISYAGWLHPLSPYRRKKVGDVWRSEQSAPGPFGYRNWLGVTVALPHEDESLARRAAMVREWQVRRPDLPARVIVAGWSMDNMKPRDFVYSSPPLLRLDDAALYGVVGMIEAAEQIALALRAALVPVLSEGEAREAVREAFYAETEPVFERLATGLTAVNITETAREWLDAMAKAAIRLFEANALPGLADRDQKSQEAIIGSYRFLRANLAGTGKYGAKAREQLGLPREGARKTEEPA